MTKSSFYTGTALTTVDPPVPDLASPGTGDSPAPSSFFHDSTAYDNIADPDAFAAAAQAAATAAAASAAAAAASAATTAAALGPVTASEFIVSSASAALSAERVATDTPSVTWDFGIAGQAKAKRAALTGDVTASADSNATTIANDAVTFAKMANIATDSLIGRDTAGTGDPENITLNATLSMTGAGALQREALTGDVTASAGSNATTIAANAVDNTKLRDSGALSVIGRSANTSGDPADIAAVAASGAVLRESGSTIGFGTVATAGIANLAVTYGKMQQASASSLLGNPTGSLANVSEITLNATLSFTGTTLQRAALTGDVTASAGSNATTIANDAVTYAKMQNVSATDRLIGRQTAGAGDPEEITCTAAGRALIDDADAATQRTTLGLGTIATFNEGTAAEYRANTSGKALSTDKVWSAADLVTLTDAATVAVDLGTGFNFVVTLAGNRTLGNPTNTKNGQTGVIKVIQDATGSRTLAYGTNYKFAGGTAPTLSTAANAIDNLFYFVESSTRIVITGIIKDVK